MRPAVLAALALVTVLATAPARTYDLPYDPIRGAPIMAAMRVAPRIAGFSRSNSAERP